MKMNIVPLNPQLGPGTFSAAFANKATFPQVACANRHQADLHESRMLLFSIILKALYNQSLKKNFT